MEIYERERGRTFALRRTGFDGKGLPFEFESKDRPFDYWQKKFDESDKEELIREATELHTTKADRVKHLKENGVTTPTAYRWLGDKKNGKDGK
jgi:hypothetical protein